MYRSERWKLSRARKADNYWVKLGDHPLVTCYIPTHNRVDLLVGRSLPSILIQTYTNLEVIVAAHGCTDGTKERVEELGDPRVRVIEVPRTQTYPPTAENHWLAGPVVPANAALDAARGRWIARCDDDDIWTVDHVAALLSFALRTRSEFVSSAYVVHDANKDDYIVVDDGEKVPIGGTQTWLYRDYLKFMRYNPECWRKKWDRVNDTDLADRFRRAGVRISHLNEITAHIAPRPGADTVGFAAYKNDPAGMERHFAFDPVEPPDLKVLH